VTADRSHRDGDDANMDADDATLAALAVELDLADPLPEHLVTIAEDSYVWRNAEAELLELLVDSALEALPLSRAEPLPRVIAFGDGDRGIHFECQHASKGIVLRGALQPSGTHVVVAERVDATDSAESDPFGLFELGPIAPGRVRLIVRSLDGTDLMVTPWFVLESP